MIDSKGWDWHIGFEDRDSVWKKPALESCGLMYRWAAQVKKAYLYLGCGLGRHAILFGRNGFTVSCFDISTDAVAGTRQWAEAEGLKLSYAVGDMLSLPYPSGSFDCVLCWNVISPSDTEGVKKAIAEMGRVLRRDGEAYLTLGSKCTWGWQQDWPMVDDNTKLRMEEGPEYNVPHFYADKPLIEELFQDFEILSITHVEDWGSNNRGIHYHVLVKKNTALSGGKVSPAASAQSAPPGAPDGNRCSGTSVR